MVDDHIVTKFWTKVTGMDLVMMQDQRIMLKFSLLQ